MSPTQKSALLCAVLFGIVLWTYWPVVHNEFIGYDDPVYVTGNGHVQQGLSWKSVEWAFSTPEGGNWHPLTWLSHMIDCQLFGLSARAHHLVSILIHALNAVLVFLLLNRLAAASRSALDATWLSYIVALLFALHPLRVESVAWVAERKDVLSAFFGLLTLIAYAEYASNMDGNEVERPNSEVQKSRLKYGIALFLFALGLMSKPMLVTLPFVLLLLDYWPLRRLERSKLVFLLIEKIPFFGLVAISSAVTVVVQRKGGAMSLAIPFIERVENAMISYCRYLGKFFYPSKLAFFYPYPSGWPIAILVSAILLLMTVSAVAILWRRQRQYLFVGWFWFVGTLIPVIGLVQVGEQSLADRYTYFPSIGLCLALVWGAVELARNWKSQGTLIGVLAAAIAIVCVARTRDQIGIWKNNEALFTHAIAVTKGNYIAHNNLGVIFEQKGQLDKAAAEFNQAIADKPDYAQAHKNLGVVFERKGDTTNAISEYRESIQLNPAFAEGHNALGALFRAHGQLDEALEEFQQALKLKPDYVDAHFNLALVDEGKGLLDAAVREYREVLEVQPNRADVHNNLGVAFDKLGRIDDAIREYVAAIELDPRYPRARFNLGVALSKKGALAPAIEQFQEALKLKPDYKEAQMNLNALMEARQKQ